LTCCACERGLDVPFGRACTSSELYALAGMCGAVVMVKW
jgi:hypothetical protein